MAKKRVSLRDIARVTGVSVATVSRVAGNKGGYSEETRQIVAQALADAGYATSSASGGGGPLFGLVANTCDNEFFSGIVDEMSRKVSEAGSFLTVLDCAGDASREAAALEQLYDSGVSGVMLLACRSREVIDAVRDDVPCVLVDMPQNERQGLCSVKSDNYVGGQLVAQEFLRHGVTRPIVLANRSVEVACNPRVQGFLADFAAVGHPVAEAQIYQASTERPSAFAASDLVTYLRTKGVEFDAVFACSDWQAYGSVVALLEMGVAVPREVRVAGYDGIRIARYSALTITTVQQDGVALADEAVARLRALAGGNQIESEALVPVRLLQGQTT